VLLNQVLGAIEDHRKRTGHDPDAFAHIQSLCRKSSEDAGAAVPLYTLYRVNLEHPGMMTEEQFESAFLQAVQTLSK
jgi:hypothetical protein